MRESPNKAIGRRGYKPEAIVIHITQGNFNGAKNWLMNPKSQVSAHFLTKRDGYIEPLVKVENTAWHCGIVKNCKWPGLKAGVNPNLYTIGIENEGFIDIPPTGNQIWALARLVRFICRKYSIPINNFHIIPHNWIRSDKTCPGPYFEIDKIIWLANLINTDDK
jgi:N-acetylmuramoyl-L-alanine amidase